MDNRSLIATLMACLTLVATIFIMARCSVEMADNCRLSNGTQVVFGDCIQKAQNDGR